MYQRAGRRKGLRYHLLERKVMESVPRYVANPLQGFLDYLKESMRLLHMSMRGIGMIRCVPNTLTVLGEHAYSENPSDDPVRRKEEFHKGLKEAEALAKFAEKECDDGFPLLHAHTLVGAWSAMENAIEDALVGTLMNEPTLLQAEAFSKIRIPLTEFEVLEKDERMRFLVEELERGQGLGKKQGVDGFEMLLEHVTLGGPVDAEIKKTLWEIYHVRNVIVHRGAVGC